MRASEPCNAVEQNDDVHTVLNQPLGAFQHNFRDPYVVFGVMSKVELMTSPWTDRCMSVTSSGRSSISNTMRTTSGWLVEMLLASFLRTVVLPAFGGATYQSALAFSERGDDIDQASGYIFLALDLEP